MPIKFHRAFTLIEIMIVVAIIAMLAAIALPGFKRSIDTARQHACAMNRKSIDSAKLQWAVEHKKPLTDEPTDAELFGPTAYVEHKPDCPAGGAYTLRAVQEKCTCSVTTHAE